VYKRDSWSPFDSDRIKLQWDGWHVYRNLLQLESALERTTNNELVVRYADSCANRLLNMNKKWLPYASVWFAGALTRDLGRTVAVTNLLPYLRTALQRVVWNSEPVNAAADLADGIEQSAMALHDVLMNTNDSARYAWERIENQAFFLGRDLPCPASVRMDMTGTALRYGRECDPATKLGLISNLVAGLRDDVAVAAPQPTGEVSAVLANAECIERCVPQVMACLEACQDTQPLGMLLGQLHQVAESHWQAHRAGIFLCAHTMPGIGGRGTCPAAAGSSCGHVAARRVGHGGCTAYDDGRPRPCRTHAVRHGRADCRGLAACRVRSADRRYEPRMRRLPVHAG